MAAEGHQAGTIDRRRHLKRLKEYKEEAEGGDSEGWDIYLIL